MPTGTLADMARSLPASSAARTGPHPPTPFPRFFTLTPPSFRPVTGCAGPVCTPSSCAPVNAETVACAIPIEHILANPHQNRALCRTLGLSQSILTRRLTRSLQLVASY